MNQIQAPFLQTQLSGTSIVNKSKFNSLDPAFLVGTELIST